MLERIIALAALAVMLLLFRPLCRFLRGTEQAGASGRKGGKDSRRKGKSPAAETYVISDQQEKIIGLTVFTAIMIGAFLLRVLIAVIHKGYETDMNCFLLWGDMVYNDGIGKFYLSESFHDYPPGYMYILYVIGWLRSVFGIAWDSAVSILMTKMPAILADLGTGYLLYRVASRRFKESGAALLSAIYLFCPLVILDSVVWGQTDSVFTFFIVLMCYLITEKKLIPSYFVFALAILVKPQSLIFTPVLIYGIIDQVFLEDFNWKKFWTNLGLGLAAILLIGLLMLPFGFHEALGQYTDTLGSYEYASVNAYNFWTLCKLNWESQDGAGLLGITYKNWGTVAIVLTVAAATIMSLRCKKERSKYYFLGAFIVTCVFLFSVRMHERYIFPAAILLLMAFAVRPRKALYVLYSLLSAVSFYNIAYVLFHFDPNNYDRGDKVMFLVSFLALAVFGVMVYVAVKYYCQYREERVEQEEQAGQVVSRAGKRAGQDKSVIRASEKMEKMTRADYIIMGVITLIYGIVAFYHLGNMSAPETTYSVVQEGTIQLDFGQQVTFSKMWDFLGYKNNPTYIVEYTSDPNGQWTALYSEGNTWDAGSVFAWNSIDLPVTTQYIRIYPSSATTEDSLQELVFQDAEGNEVLPVNSYTYPNLFDEQELFEGSTTNDNGTYFDEIYHARTAYEMIHDQYCYENTHPPLGKFIMSLGIRMFGMDPFGWRFMGNVFGILMLPVFYLFGKKMFRETWAAGILTVLFAFDFMHFAQTRIATIDVFVTLFIIISYFFMYCYSRLSFYDTELKKTFIPLGLCGIAMGLGWASKWTGIYSSAGLAVIFFALMVQRFREYIYAVKHPDGATEGILHKDIVDNFHKKLIKTLLFCCVFFVLIPAVIYTLSYIPMNDGTDRGLIARMIASQKTMYDYHSKLDSKHAYSSKWYQWPIMYRPIWYYSRVISDTVREGISAFGNPLVWWAGIPAFLVMLYLIFAKKDRKAAFLAVGYLSQYAPWMLIGRVVFIYHYFPSVPFITAMVVYCMYLLVKRFPKAKKWMFVYTGAALVLFIMFYPVLSGEPTTVDYVQHWLKWFKTWVLLQTWQ